MSECKTKEDAYARVINARMGCFAGEPTEEYLTALRSQLYAFIGEVERELFDLWSKEAAALEQAESSEE